MEKNDEDIPNSLPDVLKREIGLTKEELNLTPQGIQGALNLLSTLRLNRVKKEEDIIRVLDDVLEELLNKVIPWTEQILKVMQGGLKTEGLIEWLFPKPGAEGFYSGYMLYHVQRNILKVEKISSKLVIRLNLANEVLNYLSSIGRARGRTWRMYELYLRGERSMVGSLPVGFILSAHKTTQTVLSFFEEYGDSIFFELNVEMRDIIKRFVQNLELSKTMLPKLKEADSLERIEKMLKEHDQKNEERHRENLQKHDATQAEVKAQGGKIEQGMQEVKQGVQKINDKIEPPEKPLPRTVQVKELVEYLKYSECKTRDTVNVLERKVREKEGRGLKMEGNKYVLKNFLEDWEKYQNEPEFENVRKAQDLYRKQNKTKKPAAPAKKKRGPAR